MENRYQYTRYNEGATLEYIRKFILEHNPFLKDYVYENNPESLYFYQKDTQSNNFLSIGYVVKYTGVIYRGGFNCNTSIRIVEDLLNALIAKHIHPVGDFSINFSTTIDFNKYTVYDFEMIWDSFKQFDNYDLSTNKEILDKLCEHYSNVIKQYFIPFWKKYSNIQYITGQQPENSRSFGTIHLTDGYFLTATLCFIIHIAYQPHNNNKQNKSRSNPYRITKTVYITIDFLQHGIYRNKF